MNKPTRRYPRVRTEVGTESLTKQSFKDECNINKIMAKFQKTGAINHYAKHGPQYGDTLHVELLDALLIVRESQEMFDDLPSSVRKRFGNDPAEFLEFMEDPANREEAIRLDLVTGRESDQRQNTTRRTGDNEIPVQNEDAQPGVNAE